jgi:molecular chaperone HscB
MNYFEVFKLPVSLQVDKSSLRTAFLKLSKQFHPDYHTLADEAQQARMLEQSTQVNQAYTILMDDDARIRHVLQLNGLLGDEQDKQTLPQSFLMDMMDINEAIMELQFEKDSARYAQTLTQVEALEAQLQTSIQPVLDTWQADQGIEPLEQVKDFFLKKRYLLRIKENLSTFAPR